MSRVWPSKMQQALTNVSHEDADSGAFTASPSEPLAVASTAVGSQGLLHLLSVGALPEPEREGCASLEVGNSPLAAMAAEQRLAGGLRTDEPKPDHENTFKNIRKIGNHLRNILFFHNSTFWNSKISTCFGPLNPPIFFVSYFRNCPKNRIIEADFWVFFL